MNSQQQSFVFHEFRRQQPITYKILWGIIVVSFFVFCVLGIRLWIVYQDMNSKVDSLNELPYYDLSLLKNNQQSESLLKSFNNVSDIIRGLDSLQQEKTRLSQYDLFLHKPYENFLINLYLPTLNIRKDPYNKQLDFSIVGQKYLEKNQFNDIHLIQNWSNYFRVVGQDQIYNDVSDVSIGGLLEDDKGYFKVSLSLSFTAPTKRSFLFLLDKLSITSNKQNIMLINEFVFNLRQRIKTQNASQIASLQQSGRSIDATIGSDLMRWISSDTYLTKLIDNDLIQKALLDTVQCDTVSEQCLFKVREKYRSLPSIAYTLGLPGGNKVAQLRDFFVQLPPLMSITKFSFTKGKKTAGNQPYNGQIGIEIYGRSLNAAEVDEISAGLGRLCFGKSLPMNIRNAKQQVNDLLVQLATLSSLDTSKNGQLLEVMSSIDTIERDYPKLSFYQKTVKLFEIYRMLKENSICQ